MNPVMKPTSRAAIRTGQSAAVALACGVLLAAASDSARAAGCAFERQGDGRVATVIDARSFRKYIQPD